MIHRLTPLFFTLCLLVLAACGADSEPRSDRGGWGRESATMPAVEAIQARYGALPLQSRLNGTVRAENQVLIYPEITAPITRVAVQNGDYVQRGAALVYLRDTQFQEQLRQAEATLQINQADAKRAEATLKEVQARLERTEQLADRQLQSAQELGTLQAEAASAEATYAQALARIAQAEATVAEAQEALRQTVVRAPISGYVGQRDAEVGMRVTGNN
ncbi:MAG: biotin/lipoyl-binding protein, partial [Bacteroidota bacterium]